VAQGALALGAAADEIPPIMRMQREEEMSDINAFFMGEIVP